MSNPFDQLAPHDQLSRTAVYIETFFDAQRLGSGTGFICQNHRGQHVLITNRHVVSGRDFVTDQPTHPMAGIPNRLVAQRNVIRADGSWGWEPTEVKLLSDDGEQLWTDHPGKTCDVAGIVVPPDRNDLGVGTQQDLRLRLYPTVQVSVIGFPFGKGVGGYNGIWVNGTIASDPRFPFEGKPCFLIDCRTRMGLSGSPVFVFSSGAMSNGPGLLLGPIQQFIGIYSGRINEESDLGFVWYAAAVQGLLDAT